MSYGFNYNKYFDIPEGKNRVTFDFNSSEFNPASENYFVDKFSKISDNKIRISFSFLGGKGTTFIMENGEHRHYLSKAKFVGSVLCDDVISIKEESTNNDDVIFAINKRAWSKNKIINIQNLEVGKITIRCKKLYAEKLDCYFQYADGWRKEEEK